MPDTDRCEAFRDAIAELALGIASGDDRARVLAHASGCRSCRRLLGELTLVGDELLQLVPEREPPPGFEVRVLERVGATGRKRRGRRPWPALVLAAVLAAAALSAGGVLQATREERRLGTQLGAVLERADGFYIGVSELRDAGGRELGRVFHYGGRPSWIVVVLDRSLPADRYRITLHTRTGAIAELGTFPLRPGDRSLSTTVAIDLRRIDRLDLRGERRGARYTARIP
jgi:hypothetical protein